MVLWGQPGCPIALHSNRLSSSLHLSNMLSTANNMFSYSTMFLMIGLTCLFGVRTKSPPDIIPPGQNPPRKSHFFQGGFCPGGLCLGGIMSWGDYVQGGIMSGGDFVLHPVYSLLQPLSWCCVLDRYMEKHCIS